MSEAPGEAASTQAGYAGVGVAPKPPAGEHLVARTGDLKPGEHRLVRINNIELGLYNIAGNYYAVHNMCPHQFGPVCQGVIAAKSVADESTGWKTEWVKAGEVLVCPWHGMQFDILDGQSLSDKNLRLRTFPVRVADDEVWVLLKGRRTGAAA